MLTRFCGEQACVNSAKNGDASPSTYEAPQFISAVDIACMNTDSNDIARANPLWLKRLQTLINYNRVAEGTGSRFGWNVKPPRRDDTITKRHIARIYQIYLHGTPVKPSKAG